MYATIASPARSSLTLEQTRERGRIWSPRGVRPAPPHAHPAPAPRALRGRGARCAPPCTRREPYDVPLWCDPKVHRDQHAQVDKALYSLPARLVGEALSARADRSTVRFYDGATLVKAHPRVAPGQRPTDPNDFPTEKTAYAMRDVTFLAHKAARARRSRGPLRRRPARRAAALDAHAPGLRAARPRQTLRR